MADDSRGASVEGAAQPADAGESAGSRGGVGRLLSRRVAIVAAAAIAGAVALGLLTWVVVDQVTRSSVPGVEGDTLAQAMAAVDEAGMGIELRTESMFCEKGSLAPDLCVVSSQTPAADERVHANATTVVIDVVPSEVKVPDLEEMSFSEAVAATTDLGIEIRPVDSTYSRVDGYEEWEVVSQSEQGTIPAGTQIEVVLDRPLAGAPDVVGASLSDATAALEAAGFSTSSSSPLPGFDGEMVVTEMTPQLEDGKLPVGTTVALHWGVRVPNVVGMTDLAGTSTLSNAGFDVTGSSSSSRKIATQEPAAGTVTEYLSDITITLEAPTVVYEVVGNGSRASVTWIAPGTFDISQATNEALPWRMTFQTEASYRNFNAQALNGNSITCHIYVNGELLKTNTSTGPYAVVSCG